MRFSLTRAWLQILANFLQAALFSAIISQLLGQTTSSLQPDYSAATVSLLTESVALQRAAILNINISHIPSSKLSFESSTMPSKADVWINGLWIVSLYLTLATALVVGVVLQWINFYMVDIPSGTSRDRACTRQYRSAGLNRWHVPAIIETLPVLMNVALFLFLAGFIIYIQGLSGLQAITWLIVPLSWILLLVYSVASMIPVAIAQCPYKTSLSKVYIGILWVIHHASVRILNLPKEGGESLDGDDPPLPENVRRYV